MQKSIQTILNEKDFDEKKRLFNQLHKELASVGKSAASELKTLLLDSSAEIRRETAFLLNYWDIQLTEEESYRFLFAIQDIKSLKTLANQNTLARKILLEGMKDKNLRVREKILRHFHLTDCRTDKEKALYFYCRGDYTALLKLCQEDSIIEFVVDLLNEGLLPEKNTPYHRRQCSMTLQQLGFLAEGKIELTDVKKPKARTIEPPPQLTDLIKSPIQQFLDRMNQKGLLINGKRLYPEIHQVSATNRITYKNPGVQGWSRQKRIQAIQPPKDMLLYSYDFKEIEPRLLFNFMIQNFWISYDDVNVDDVYLLFNRKNRKKGKHFLNVLINGGSPHMFPLDEQTGKIVDAIQEFRMELVESARGYGYTETLAGEHIYISPDEENFTGKVMNRLIQGSASDFFNDAVISLQSYIDLEGIEAEIVLLLFDEVWVAVNQTKEEEITEKIESFLNHISDRWYLPLKITVKKTRISK